MHRGEIAAPRKSNGSFPNTQQKHLGPLLYPPHPLRGSGTAQELSPTSRARSPQRVTLWPIRLETGLMFLKYHSLALAD